MKKRILISFILALVVALGVSTTAFAYDPPGGSANADVSVSDVTITPASPNDIHGVSDTVTASGTVTIISTASASGSPYETNAESNAWYSVMSPTGILVDSGNNAISDLDSGHNASASQTYDWTSTFTLNEEGEYVISQGGEANADASWTTGSGWWHTHHNISASDEDSVSKVLQAICVGTTGPSWSAMPTQFTLKVGERVAYDWTNGKAGDTLPAITQAGDTVWLGKFTTLKVVITEGTVVTGGYYLEVAMKANGSLYIRTIGNIVKFSSPVTVYEKKDGNWTQILQFTKVANGIPQ